MTASDLTLRIDGENPIRTLRAGFGSNIHAIQASLPEPDRVFAGSAWGATPLPEDGPAWDSVCAHLDWLGMDWVRLELQASMYAPERGVFTFDSTDMRLLKRYLDYFQARGARIFLQQMWHNCPWLTPEAFRHDPNQVIRCAPADLPAFADALARLVEHLLRDCGYTCIDHLCLSNEPYENWSWWMESFEPPRFGSIEPALRLVRRALDDRGLSLPLAGPDISFHVGHALRPDNIPYADVLGAYDFHSYADRFDNGVGLTPFPLDRLGDAAEGLAAWCRFAHAQGKPCLISEMGSFQYGFLGDNPGPALFPSLVKDIEKVLRFLQAGADGFNRWSYLNVGTVDGNWQLIDTCDKQRRPLPPPYQPHGNNYVLWGLLTRFTALHSQLMPCSFDGETGGRLFAACLRAPRTGKLSIYLVNDGETPRQVQLQARGLAGSLRAYQVDQARHDGIATQKLARLIVSDAVTSGSVLDLPAWSVTCLTAWRLEDDEPGVVLG